MCCRLRGEEFSVSVNSFIKQACLKKLYDDLGTVQTSGDLKTSKTVADYKKAYYRGVKKHYRHSPWHLRGPYSPGHPDELKHRIISSFLYNTWSLFFHFFFLLALSKSEYAWTLRVALESGFLVHSIRWHFCHIIPAPRWMSSYSTPLRVSYCPRSRNQGHPLSGFEGCS